MVLGDADDGARRQRLEAGGDPEGIGQGTPLDAQLRVRDRHLEEGAEHPVDRRAPEQLRHSRTGRELAPAGRGGLAEAGHAPVHGGLLHRGEGGIDRGAVGQRAALAPSLGLVGHDADEEQRADPVGAGGGADGLAERELHVDELDAAEPHGGGPPTPPP